MPKRLRAEPPVVDMLVISSVSRQVTFSGISQNCFSYASDKCLPLVLMVVHQSFKFLWPGSTIPIKSNFFDAPILRNCRAVGVGPLGR